METLLKAKHLGPYVLIPAIESEDDRHLLSLIFQVGGQGDEEIKKIDPSNLEVELQDTSGNALEMISRPEPGPMEYRGSRSLQSTARFVFQSSGNQLKTLNVYLGENSASFDFFLKYEEKDDFESIPKKGDRFPFRRPARNILETILYATQDLLRAIYIHVRRLFHKHCCVERFEAPLNYAEMGNERYFEMEADFKSEGNCKCECCRYAQYLRGTIVDAAGNDVNFPLPDGPLDPTIYREDGIIDEFGPDNHGFYGDRGHPQQPHDQYLPDQADGCQFRGSDTPRMEAGDQTTFEFVGMIIDTCEGTIKAVKSWKVTWP